MWTNRPISTNDIAEWDLAICTGLALCDKECGVLQPSKERRNVRLPPRAGAGLGPELTRRALEAKARRAPEWLSGPQVLIAFRGGLCMGRTRLALKPTPPFSCPLDFVLNPDLIPSPLSAFTADLRG
jgi:hypothetical protein